MSAPAKRAARDNTTLTAQQNRAMDAIDGRKPARKPRFLSQGRKGLSFDQAAFDRAQRLIGLKGYITNIPTHTSPATEIIGHHHELWHVEQSFRMSKHDLKAHPIFHHTMRLKHSLMLSKVFFYKMCSTENVETSSFYTLNLNSTALLIGRTS